jgi:hypothetical protein
MDRIGQEPKLGFRFLRGRWLDVAMAVGPDRRGRHRHDDRPG